MKRIVLIFSLLTLTVWSDTIGLNINNRDIEAEASFNLTSAIGYGDGIDYFLGVDYLHTDNDSLVKAAFGASSTLSGAESLTLAFGLEAAFSDNFAALPLFGQAALRLPFDEPIPATSLVARVDYAPSALSFIDADSYLEYRFEADIEVIPNIHLYGGYRNIDTQYNIYDHTLNDSWYGGLKIGF